MCVCTLLALKLHLAPFFCRLPSAPTEPGVSSCYHISYCLVCWKGCKGGRAKCASLLLRSAASATHPSKNKGRAPWQRLLSTLEIALRSSSLWPLSTTSSILCTTVSPLSWKGWSGGDEICPCQQLFHLTPSLSLAYLPCSHNEA